MLKAELKARNIMYRDVQIWVVKLWGIIFITRQIFNVFELALWADMAQTVSLDKIQRFFDFSAIFIY